jgi:hypothetical protein
MKLYKIIIARPGVCCFIVFSLFFGSVSAQDYPPQMRYIQANNCNCSIGTFTNSSAIEWYGDCSNGYCNGYGTVNYYDPNGSYSGKYIGYVSQGTLNGFGTKYYADGSILYQGRFKDNIFLDQAPYMLLNDPIMDFVIDSLLSGGINRRCDIVKSVFSKDDDLLEIRYRVSCDGQFVETNHYTCTLVYSNQPPYIDIVDANDNAQVFITLNLLKYSKRLYDWIQSQSQNK